MKVLKFGGTSVGSVNSILSVKKIVEAIEEPVIVVVSALGGITDKLLATSTMASKGDLAYEKELSEIIARHLDVIEGVIEDKEVRMDVQKKVMALLDELSNIFKGVYLINDLSAKTSDTIVSYGERLSSLIVSNVIKDAKLFDSRKYIKTVKQFNKHIVDFDLTNKLIKETFSPLPKVSLVPGFISSSTETGEVTNLGRGGSDYTASILATALDANTLEIWTDVDGFMTADPRVISSAYVIDRLTFTEAMELCNFGAKVIYPPTIYPVYHKNIPIRILNTFNPTAPGTYISKERVKEEGKAIIKGISSINDTCLITVQGLGMVGVIGVNYKEEDLKYGLWKTIESRTFPGSVSNHHLGTQLGMLMAAYEMNQFRDAYQSAIIRNAKSFARSLKSYGLDVVGDPAIDYTETHQVIVSVGYGEGAEIAERLEQNNVIVNYQATPDEEGFTASGALRMGVSEMTRFGFEEKDFDQLASLMADCILRGREIKADVERLRASHTEMRYCFDDAAINDALEQLAGKLDI